MFYEMSLRNKEEEVNLNDIVLEEDEEENKPRTSRFYSNNPYLKKIIDMHYSSDSISNSDKYKNTAAYNNSFNSQHLSSGITKTSEFNSDNIKGSTSNI